MRALTYDPFVEPMPATILVVDDDLKIVRLVRTYLEREGYRVAEALDGRSALAAIALEAPALVVLDVMLPEVDGLSIVRAVRRTGRTPIIMLSARGTTADRIAGLAAGADDYLPKPFSPAELVVRVQRVLERSTGPSSATAGPDRVLRRGDLVLDLDRHEVTVAGRDPSLTALEFRLLAALLEADGRVLSRDQLMDAVYPGGEAIVLDRTIDALVKRLREKLGDDAVRPRYVMTVRSVGYVPSPPPAARQGPRGARSHRGGWVPDRRGRHPRGGPRGRDRYCRDARAGRGRVHQPHDRRRPPGRSGSLDVRRLGQARGARRPLVAVMAATVLSAALGRRIARPLRDVGRAARRIAGGDYAARVPRTGLEELTDLADSFNQMATALEEQERLRQELIANAAHELRTPLTNLQGYLEALRDEVIPADRATFESLWDEANASSACRARSTCSPPATPSWTGRRSRTSTWPRPCAARPSPRRPR